MIYNDLKSVARVIGILRLCDLTVLRRSLFCQFLLPRLIVAKFLFIRTSPKISSQHSIRPKFLTRFTSKFRVMNSTIRFFNTKLQTSNISHDILYIRYTLYSVIYERETRLNMISPLPPKIRIFKRSPSLESTNFVLLVASKTELTRPVNKKLTRGKQREREREREKNVNKKV